MAISRHSHEWKRTMAMAALLGVTFQQIASGRYDRGRPRPPIWRWALRNGLSDSAHSKIAAARCALATLGVDEFLPDAAKTRAGRKPGAELRSS